MGLISAFVATYANTKTSAPIYICAVLYIAMVSSALLPEPYEGKTNVCHLGCGCRDHAV
jgi:hypothetical protein